MENIINKLYDGKQNQQGELFGHTQWNPLVNYFIVDEFEHRWRVIVSSWSTKYKKVVYFIKGTWIKLKREVCVCVDE